MTGPYRTEGAKAQPDRPERGFLQDLAGIAHRPIDSQTYWLIDRLNWQ